METARASLEMIQDRVRWSDDNRERIVEALESALRVGRGRVCIRLVDAVT